MRTIIRRPVIKQCPHRDETDAGELVIEFDGPAPELHALASRIDELCAGLPLTHEQFTELVASELPEAHVTTTWHTGPWAVEVSDAVRLR